jgi:UDP-GlcNAc:undecaprenyl-phosphate/decaprenyl-phosphate GlcNAc-1-phosphate transferase
VLALSLALALACAGFLPFNLRPNRAAAVFMGDSGSQVLGFALAALGLTASWKVAGTTVATLLLPVLVLAVPILDTTLVTVVRLLDGRPVYQGGRDHTSHRLVYHGLSEKRAVVLLAVISAALGATSLFYAVLDNAWVTLIGVLLTFALLVQFASVLSDVERSPGLLEERSWLRTFVANPRRLVESLVDFALITASFAAAYYLRLQGGGTDYERHIFLVSLAVLLAVRYAAFIPFGLYRGVWRYAGARDAAAIVGAVVVSEVVAYLILDATQVWGAFPRSIFIIDALVCTVLVGASRFSERAFVRAVSTLTGRGERRRTLIVGAGRGGRSLLRELRETAGEQVVGFVDDDPRLARRRLQGVPVLGGLMEIEAVLAKARPDTVLVTIPDAPRERLSLVIDACALAEVPCRFVRRETDLDPRVALGASVD